eukprot:CAMPEP_0182435866 /NCGR_PEP_ID=MMETSP1167-20130531/78043_1 /TAXON_ID=2988 /ORGANISM="Mallomonas Sp, Strain CCMP3275" /LENGTH=128 /DNA_ID=CAMNT_0024627351 /DNA_START=277 /DNA_END=660 /DNA_ORIENTATION=+
MAFVLFVMVGIGTYQGFAVRRNRENNNFGEAYKEAATVHYQAMSLATFFFFIGGTGGLNALLIMEKPILESTHATTGLISMLMLSIQAALSVAMNSVSELRTVHAYFGVATVTMLLAHFAFGVQLAVS